MANTVRAAIVQTAWTGDKESMVEKNMKYARDAAEQGAQVMCFQEMFNAPYFCQVQDDRHKDTAELIPDGPTTQKMIALAVAQIETRIGQLDIEAAIETTLGSASTN